MPLQTLNFYTLKQIRVKQHRVDLGDFRVTSPYACTQAIRLLLQIHEAVSENFGIITLNTKHKILGFHIIAIGTLNQIIVQPREVYQAAILNNAAAIIAFHNHPSGDPTPSLDDIIITQTLNQSGKFLNIELMDHLIIGEDGYVSLRERGVI